MEAEKHLTKKEKSRLKIMHAAKGLFEKQGIDGTTFTQIAKEADVCRTTVFNHFAGTKELMFAIFAQEVDDLVEYCEKTDMSGVSLVYALFDRLIEDTAYYPMLSARLLNNAVLSRESNNPITIIEQITEKNLCEAASRSISDESGADQRQKAMLICGAYYGLVNHYYINNKSFDEKIMKKELHAMLEIILGGKEHEQFGNQQMG